MVQTSLLFNGLMVFLEGVLTFISPCLLPMLPVYYLYLAGSEGKGGNKTVITNALGFVLGFSIVFISLGMLVASAGVAARSDWFRIGSGIVIAIMGLYFLGIFKPLFMSREARVSFNVQGGGFFRSVLLGATLSFGWTPCVGPMLASALATAANAGSHLYSLLLLALYCIGLGIPFVLTAALFEKLRGTIKAIEKHSETIRIVSGVFLIIMGILIATGWSRYI